MRHDITYDLQDEAATLGLGARLSSVLHAGMTLYLHGDLGAGKTTLVRGLLHQAGHLGKVKSPTYTLVEPYLVVIKNIKTYIYHFDLYRFYEEEEWESAGFRDYFNPQSICIVEWPEKAGEMLPVADIDVSLAIKGEGRTVHFVANTDQGRRSLGSLF